MTTAGNKQGEPTESHSKRFKLFATLSWIFIWPIILLALTIGFVLLIVLALGDTYAKEAPSGLEIRGYALLVLAAMVMLCLIFARQQKRSKYEFLRRGSRVLSVYMWLGMSVGGLVIVGINDPTANTATAGINTQTASSFVIPPLQHDPSIVATLQQIGATNIDAIDERYVDGYNEQLTDQQGKYQAYINPTTGDFLYGTLTVKRGLDKNEEKTMIAHEYLHHVWFAVLDEPTKQNLTSHLITLYGRDPWMQERVKEYSDDGILQPTELFSYYCTESTDGYLSIYVKDKCNAYINRAALTMAR